MDNYKDIIFRDSLDGLYLDGTGKWSLPPTSSGMIYPSAGIALSTGSAWGTSIADNHVNWDTAYTHSQLTSGNPHSVTWSELTGSRSSITLSGFSKDLVLDDLTDVNVGGATNDQTIVYTTGTWLPRNYNLDGLSDVIIGTPTAGEALIYTSGAWRNATVPAPSYLYEIGDVYASMSPSDGEALMWDGTNTRWDAGTIGNSHTLLAHSDVTADTAAQAQIIANSATSGFTWKNVKIEIPGAGTSGLTGGYFTYVADTTDKMSLDLAVNFAGSGTASTVARSDHNHSGTYDNYQSWQLQIDGGALNAIASSDILQINSGTGISLSWASPTLTINSTATAYSAGDGIDITGSVISAKINTLRALQFNPSHQLEVKLGTNHDEAAYGDHGHTEYVATVGDTMSGSLTVDGSGDVYSIVNAAGYFDIRAEGAASGWARGLRAMNTSTLLMEIGFLGTATPSVSYAFIGKDWTNTSARFYPNGAAQLYYNNSLKIATTSTGATLNGSPIVNEAHRDFDKTWQSLSGTGSVTWNVTNGYNAYMSITGNVTLTVSNLEDGDYGVLFVNCAASSYTITFPTGTKQAGGGGNTVSTSAGTSYKDIISFVYRGTTLYLTVGQKFS